MYTPSVMNSGSPPSLDGAMSGWIVIALLLAGCRDAHPCPTEEERFDPEVAFEDTLGEAPSGDEAREMVCAGGLTLGDWAEISETSPGYEPMVALCGTYWCVEEFVSRSVCVLRSSVDEWRERDCPACEVTYADDFSYPTINVTCGP